MKFYAISSVVDNKEGVQRITFHGPWDDGYEMEGEIDDKELSKDTTVFERLLVKDDIITRLPGPYQPGQEEIDWIDGPPTSDGHYWVQVNNNKFVSYVNLEGDIYVTGRTIPIERSAVEKHKPISL